jgi:hypothetical protein
LHASKNFNFSRKALLFSEERKRQINSKILDKAVIELYCALPIADNVNFSKSSGTCRDFSPNKPPCAVDAD